MAADLSLGEGKGVSAIIKVKYLWYSQDEIFCGLIMVYIMHQISPAEVQQKTLICEF